MEHTDFPKEFKEQVTKEAIQAGRGNTASTSMDLSGTLENE